MLDKGFKAFQYTLDFINAVPAHTWYTVGVFLGSGVLASVTLWGYKKYHKLKQLEAPLKHGLGYVLALVSSLLTVADFYLTNSKGFPTFFGSAAPTIFAAATAVHQLGDSKLFRKFFAIGNNIVGQKNTLKTELTDANTPVVPEPDAGVTPAPRSTDLFS